ADVDGAAMDAVEETDRRHPRDVGAAVAARRIEIEIALHVESRRRREDHAPGGRGVCLVFVETRMPEPALERDPNAPVTAKTSLAGAWRNPSRASSSSDATPDAPPRTGGR